ncbi:hypothetical protein CB0940_05924 [Cercospora beticola]|uniref:Uncharacterized protein n=1 Tax=Cercospora beticola TaxID=122368 RepID=A0A2G5HX39_CERBT|nr:hypothetical protein CB0940_05924 [Cercospora beticola]PIA97090.1 hypothetical protein CB0940_05924 [Cercospora beticola]WPA98521.1 hypothetical protein RHO25_003133 [Cercospora beticola]
MPVTTRSKKAAEGSAAVEVADTSAPDPKLAQNTRGRKSKAATKASKSAADAPTATANASKLEARKRKKAADAPAAAAAVAASPPPPEQPQASVSPLTARPTAPISSSTRRLKTPTPPGNRPHTSASPSPAKVLSTTPNGTLKDYRQVTGAKFPDLGPVRKEDYTRDVDEEDHLSGRRKGLSTSPDGSRTTRGARYSPPRRSPTLIPSSSDYVARPGAIPYEPPEPRREQPQKAFFRSWPNVLSSLAALLLVAWLIVADPGNWQAQAKLRFMNQQYHDSNARRIMIDPLGTSHIVEVNDISLSVSQFCVPNAGGSSTTSGIAKGVNINVANFREWNDLVRKSREPEISALYGMFHDKIPGAEKTAQLSTDLEARMCEFADELVGKGLAHEKTRSFASKLRSYRESATRLNPTQTPDSNKAYDMAKRLWAAARPGDWDHGLVEGAFTDLKEYLESQQQLALAMSEQSSEVFADYARFIKFYRAYQKTPGEAEYKRQVACRDLYVRKWPKWGYNCDRTSHAHLLAPVKGDRDPAIMRSMASQYYLQEAGTIWNNYAKHLGDGLSLLADMPKLKKDLAAEGIPARIEHLVSLLDNLANQADNTAVLLQDAYERKYAVPIDFEAKPDDGIIRYTRPESGRCNACNERTLSSWSSSSIARASADELWSSLYDNDDEQATETTKPAWASHLTTASSDSRPTSERRPEITTSTQLVKIVDIQWH